MDSEREKRPSEDVLFRWDPRGHSMNFDSVSVGNDVFIKRRMTESKNVDESHQFLHKLDENEAAELNRMFKDSSTDGLNLNPELLSKNRDKRAELMKNLKKFQLNSCKDWLGSNTHKSSLEKVDTLDRLSSVIINPEFPMKHEAVLYSIQLGRSDFDFYNALHLTKLSRMSNPAVLELLRQPVFVRNRMLLLTDGKKCNCPLNVLTKQQPPQRHLFQSKPNFMESTVKNQPQQTYPPPQQVGFGDSLFNRLLMPHGNVMSPGLFGMDRNYSSLFGQDKRYEAEKKQEILDENDIMCPFHVAKEFPEVLKSTKEFCGVIKHYDLFYKYQEVKISSKTFHVLYLYNLNTKLSERFNNRVYQYKLPSKLLAVNHVYLRDFEYERYYSNNNLYNSGNYMSSNLNGNKDRSVYLANVYSGDALFLVTKTEFLIALINFNNYSTNAYKEPIIRLGVILRDKNYGHNVKEVLCHKGSGRIFLLESNSMLYEYQYQFGFGPKSFRDYKMFNYLFNTLQYAKSFFTNFVRSNSVYYLSNYLNQRNSNNNDNETANTNYVEGSADNLKDYWSVNNCLDSLDTSVNKCTCYYPPLLWNELQYSTATATNIFSSVPSGFTGVSGTNSSLGPGLTTGTSSSFYGLSNKELCRCGFGCLLNKVRRNLKCLNPWNKTFVKGGDSLAVVDQDRWTLSLLNTTSGDLNVFYINGYTTLEEYTKGTTVNERVFPYDLTLYNLKHGTMLNSLERMGFNRYSHGSKFVKILPAPVDFVQGVDLVLVDNFGIKVFVGFSNLSLTTSSSLISSSLATNLSANLVGDIMNISASNNKPTKVSSKIGLSVKGFRLPVRYMGQYRGPFGFLRSKTNVSTFQLDDLFLTMEAMRKVQNGTLVRVIATKNDSTSFFQNYATLPLSINEEFYMFNENTVQYRTLEDNQPVEFYHEFYIKLSEKEKIVTVYVSDGLNNRNYENNLDPNVDLETNLNGCLGDLGSLKDVGNYGNLFDGSKNLENKLVFVVTTEKVYRFNKFSVDLVFKSLVKYPKNTLTLIKPPPLLNSNTPPVSNSNTSRDLNLVNTAPTTLTSANLIPNQNLGLVVRNKDNEDENTVFNLNNYLNNSTGSNGNYFLTTLEQSNNTNTLNFLDRRQFSNPSYSRNDNTGYYLNYLNQRNNKREELFANIFGEDLVEICENSKELVGYSLYYLSWLYGPENMFKHVFNYLTQLLASCSYYNANTSPELNYYGTSTAALTNYYSSTASDFSFNCLNNLNNDLLYNYIFTNNLDDYNVFMGSFGIPSRIFNYVVPGCYCVLDQSFEKPAVSPWCKFISFGQRDNKVKQNRVTTSTSPLVDGLILLVSELLNPMYYNRMFNLVPQLYTNTVTNPTGFSNSNNLNTNSLHNMCTSNYNFFNPNRNDNRYLMDNLLLNRYENVNEFVIGTRVDMYLTMELSMGLDEAKKLLEQLYSLHSIVFELVKSYQKCNLENVVHLMSTLGPNVVKMLLTPNAYQYEPYPTTTTNAYFYSEPPSTTTNVYNYYGNTSDGNTGVNSNKNTSNSNTMDVNADMLTKLETLIKERYVNDLRTLKELATVLQVAQEFLASAMMLHNNTILGEYDYEFDKNLHLIQLLPSKTPKTFFSPLDFNLNWSKESMLLYPFGVKSSQESPKSKLILTKNMIVMMAQSNLVNLFLNKELFRLFRVVVWLNGGNVSALQKHFFGHIFTADEIGVMNNCNRVKFMQRHYENMDDVARAEYLHSLSKQFTLN